MSKFMHLIYLAIIALLSGLLWQAYQQDDTYSALAPTAVIEQETPVTVPSDITAASATPTEPRTSGSMEPEEVERARPREQQESPITLADLDIDMKAFHAKQTQRLEDLRTRVDREGIDQDWHYQVSQDVAAVFADPDNDLSPDMLNGVRCGTSVCEVLISDKITAPLDTLIKVQKSLRQRPWFTSDYQTLFQADAHEGNHTIFFERFTETTP